MLLTTGASDRNKIKNIYDFAGNESEYTLMSSIYSDTDACIIYRGASAWSYGSVIPLTMYYAYNYDKTAQVNYGFRVAIY